ncbi:hypothetical protein BGW36DRAFT_367955 [Talaromyces proteolyticus]|uniref:PH domain-containing protein n=1 Tax=Talaromyces proteolyticus TaxID=1131652 RepID=A0AAD4L477_9EURO|nr:uncharacterized protein BGW36DRAFT_367955 [Talaromyces proteolyticus]KAH8705652.1 hypothetical protein BGW36DRAFT_367955 [Talaromyces proteolyticus]
MDAPSAPKSAIPRRGPPLAAIRTDLAQQQAPQQQQQQSQPQRLQKLPVLQKQRLQRLQPVEPPVSPANKAPLQNSETAKRKPSKSSLKSLFSRNKALRDGKRTDSPLPQLGERRESDAHSAYAPDTPRSLTATVESSPTVVAPASDAATPTDLNSEQKDTEKKTKSKPTKKSTSPWIPPPLFQAYPQALRHAYVFTPNVSAESILRLHASRKNAAPKATQDENSTAQGSAAAKKKKEEKDKKQARRTSVPHSDTSLTRKIFVLVTSGCLLQYSGDGRHDRLPEKLMRLGPTSAAFASDAIPGKPYVIQVSQKLSDDGKLPAESGRGLWSRFGIQGTDARRMARNFFMVLTEPEEMNAWLVSLRRAIEAVGGKNFVPESPSEEKYAATEHPIQPPLSVRSSRQLSFRKSALMNEGVSRTSSRTSIAPSVSRKNSHQDIAPSSNLAKALNRRSITAPSDAISISTTATSRDPNTIYEDPRDAPLPPTRKPNVPSQPSSVKPSPANSPVQSLPATPRQLRKTGTSSTRRSMYASPPQSQPDRSTDDPEFSRRLSYVANAPSPSQSPSPTLPNFSVPSFSSRFAIPRRGSEPSVTSEATESIQASSIDSSTVHPNELRKQQLPGLNIDLGGEPVPEPAKRHSLIAETTRNNTPTPISPTKSSFTSGPRGLPFFASPSLPSLRYARQVQSPDISQRPSQFGETRSQSPAVTSAIAQRSRPLTRLPKPGDTSTPTALPSLAQSAWSTDRSKRTSPSSPHPVSQHTPVSYQTRRPSITGSGVPRAAGSASKISVPSVSRSPPSAPPTTALPVVGGIDTTLHQDKQQPQSQHHSTRRFSFLPQNQQYPIQQQTSPRKKSTQNLSLLPPAPPPDCPLPEIPSSVPPRALPSWRKHSIPPRASSLLPAPNMEASRKQSIASLSSTSSTIPTASPEMRQVGFTVRRQNAMSPIPTANMTSTTSSAVPIQTPSSSTTTTRHDPYGL